MLRHTFLFILGLCGCLVSQRPYAQQKERELPKDFYVIPSIQFGVSNPMGGYQSKGKESPFSNFRGFAETGGLTDISLMLNTGPKNISILINYISFKNDVDNDALSNWLGSTNDLEISQATSWVHHAFLFGVTKSFILKKFSIDVGGSIGGVYTETPSLSIDYHGFYNPSDIDVVSQDAGKMVINPQVQLRRTVIKNWQLALKMSWLVPAPSNHGDYFYNPNPREPIRYKINSLNTSMGISYVWK